MRHTRPVSQGCRKELPCVKEDKREAEKQCEQPGRQNPAPINNALRLRLGAPDGIMPLLWVTGLEVAE